MTGLDPSAVLQVGATALLNLALAVMVGAAAAMAAGDGLRLDRWLLRLGSTMALAGGLGVLWWQAAAMADVPLREAAVVLWPVLTDTWFGRAWTVGAVAVVGVLALAGWPSRAALVTIGLGVLVFAGSRSAVGHQAGGTLGWFWAVDLVHLLATSLWLGAVAVAVTWMRGSAPAAVAAPVAAQRIQRLSVTATWALAAVGLTGALMAWQGLGGRPLALFDSTYGWALAVKLAAVLAAVALGGYNRFVTMPRLLPALAAPPGQARGPWTRFVTVLRVEAVVLGAVALLAAVLATRPPPG